MLFYILIIFGAMVCPGMTNRAGAPKSACADLIPRHFVDPQSTKSPYEVIVSKNKTKMSDSEVIEIVLRSTTNEATIRGFICQGRIGDNPVGEFRVDSGSQAFTQVTDCFAPKVSDNC